jgi:1-acyl-sn-glycerol-3-phosphate acyltransferase
MVQHHVVPLPLVAGSEELPDRRWARRAVTVPGLLVLFVLDLALLPALLLGAAAVDAVKRRPLVAFRFQLALAVALALHVLGLVLIAASWIFGGDDEARLDARLEAWLGTLVWRAAIRIFDMHVQVEGAEALDQGPFVLMARHASLLDPLLPLFLLDRRWISLRYVIKRELLWDPCVDFLGHRLPNAFVHRGKRDTPREIARVVALADGLGPSDAVVIFPEGTRFTPKKRQRILEGLERHDPAAYERALRLRHVLPPHPGGPLALLEATGDVDVVLCAHAGLEGANHFHDLARGSLIGATVRVKLWRIEASTIPEAPDARLEWLDDRWAQIDAWVAQSLRPTA